jgi:hypothetical protein
MKEKDLATLATLADTDKMRVITAVGASKSFLYSDLKQAILSGIQIGGRNYVLNSGQIYTGSPNDWWGYDFASQEFPGMKGKTVVLSAKGSVSSWTGVSTSIFLRLKENGSDDRTIDFSETYFENKYLVINIPSDSECVRLMMRNNNNTASGFIAFIQLEIGNIPTDWRPAPEDFQLA